MKRLILYSALIICSLLVTTPADAVSLFIDDWGITANNLTPVGAPSNTSFVKEVYTGDDPNGFVGPGWGGYSFDARAAYIGFEGNKTYIAVVTGLPQSGAPDPWRYNNPGYNGYYDWNKSLEKYWYVPGSLSLDTDSDGEYDYAVTTRANTDGATYAPTPGAGTLVSGNLQFEDPLAYDRYNIAENYAATNPWAVVGFDNAADLNNMGDLAAFSYTKIGQMTMPTGLYDTYAIEAIIDNSLLGLDYGDTLTMHWTIECGNDTIDLSNTRPVPEPSTIMLLGIGIAGFMGYRRRSMK